jgi:hypothetical protein
MSQDLMKQIAEAKKQVKLTAAQHGRASQQYKNAIQHQATLVVKQMTGK